MNEGGWAAYNRVRDPSLWEPLVPLTAHETYECTVKAVAAAVQAAKIAHYPKMTVEPMARMIVAHLFQRGWAITHHPGPAQIERDIVRLMELRLTEDDVRLLRRAVSMLANGEPSADLRAVMVRMLERLRDRESVED